jgi:NitT/TauT family transport system substrate-binding protein
VTDEPVIKIGCSRIAEHFIAGVVKERLAKNDIGFSSFGLYIKPMNAFEQLSDALLAGEIEGAFLPLPFAMDLFRKGLDINLLMFVNRGGGVLIKNSSANIKRIEDFKNKTILTPCLLSVKNMLLHKMFFSSGLKLGNKHRGSDADIFLEAVPSNVVEEMINHDSDNDIGGFVAPEPFATMAIKKGNCKEVCELGSLWRYYPDNVFVLRKQMIDENRESVKEIVDLFFETGEMIDNGKNENLVQLAESFFIQDNEMVANLLLKMQGMFRSQKLIPDSSVIVKVQDYMVGQAGFVNEKIIIEDFISPSFTDHLRRK